MQFFKSTPTTSNPPHRRSTFSHIMSGLVLALGIFVATASYSGEDVTQPVNDWEVQEWNAVEVVSPPSPPVVATPSHPPGMIDAIVDWAMAIGKGQKNIDEDRIRQYVLLSFAEAKKHGIDPLIGLSVMAVESRFDYKATSGFGARGLMQVVPFWHKNKITVAEVYDPTANIRAGNQILKDCKTQQRGNVNRALLCYNGSLNVVGANYDKKVLNVWNGLKRTIQRELVTNPPK